MTNSRIVIIDHIGQSKLSNPSNILMKALFFTSSSGTYEHAKVLLVVFLNFSFEFQLVVFLERPIRISLIVPVLGCVLLVGLLREI